MITFRTLLFFVFFYLALGTALPAAAQSFREVSRAADDAVGRVIVNIGRDALGFGSGFVIGKSDTPGGYYFVTNNHVVEGGSRIRVGFLVDDQVLFYAASLLSTSSGRDLALLSLSPPDGPRLDLSSGLAVATREIEKGEDVAAIGFPGVANRAFGSSSDNTSFESTLTVGIVSRVVMGSFFDPRVRLEIIQHTAEINQGNSGGPLIDQCGVVVGVNTAGQLGVQADGIVPQGVYLSSSGPEIADFLKQSGIVFNSNANPCAGAGTGGMQDGDGSSSSAPTALMDAGTRRLAILGVLLVTAAVFTGIIVFYARGGFGRAAPASRAEPAASDHSTPVLRAEFGGKSVKLSSAALKRGITIGRSSSSEISLESSSLSRTHAKLSLDGRRLMITDLGSSNGTRLDGHPLKANVPFQINTSSRIMLADQTLTLSKP